MKNSSSNSVHTVQQPQGNARHEMEFKRKISTQGFTDHQIFDDFIQNCLDKFKFVDPMPEMYQATGNDANFIISHKSTIPDLVIWNKTFNKNECFEGADFNTDNPFPRFQFYLRVKTIKPTDQNQKKKKEKKPVKEKTKTKQPPEKPPGQNLKTSKKNISPPNNQNLNNLNENRNRDLNNNNNNSFEDNENSQEDLELVKAFNEIKIGGEQQIPINNEEKNLLLENEDNFRLINDNDDLKNQKLKDPLMFDFDINNLRGEDNSNTNKDNNSLKGNNANLQTYEQINQENVNKSKDDPNANVFQNFMNKDYENMFFNNNNSSNNPMKEDSSNNNMFNILSQSQQMSQPNFMNPEQRDSNSSSFEKVQRKKIKKESKGSKKQKLSQKGSFKDQDFQGNNFNAQSHPNFFPQNQFNEKQFYDNNMNTPNNNTNFAMSSPNFYQNNLMLQQQQQQSEMLLNIVANYFEKKGWIMIGNDGRIMAQFTSFELFQFLSERMNYNYNISLIGITDVEYNLMFTGDKIYYILSQTLPVIIQAKQNQLFYLENMNNGNNGMKNNGYMNKKFKKKKSKEPQGMPFNEPTQQEMQNHYNIHLQYIANDINFNNYPVNMMTPPNNNGIGRGNMGMNIPNVPPQQNSFDMGNNNMDFNSPFQQSFKEHAFNQMQMMTSNPNKGGAKKKKTKNNQINPNLNPNNMNMNFGFMKDEPNIQPPSGMEMNFTSENLDNVFDDEGGHF